MAYTYNPNYLGDGDLEDYSFEASLDKKLVRPNLNK
jgi:hypothetical protein